MDKQSNLVKAMTYNHPETIPLSIGFLPAAWKKYPREIKELTQKYKEIFGDLGDRYVYDPMNLPSTYKLGNTTDEWGCVWSNIDEGMEAYVTGHPIKSSADIKNLEIPQNRDGRLPHGFMYLRILDLIGFEDAMIEFALQSEEIQILIDKVLEYNCYQIEAVVDKQDKIMYFGDDLGMQKGLAIGAEKWRKYFKPCYKKMYDIVHDAGKLVYMHTDGMIYEIMPDLAEVGVNMINPQYRANGLDNLVRVCKGKIPINLDLDRQLFPFATPSQLRDHVRECVEALYLPEGGLSLNIELNKEVPIENMEAIIDEAYKCSFYKG